MKSPKIKNILKFIITLGILFLVVLTFDVKPELLLSRIKDIKFLIVVFFIPLFILPIISGNRWKLFLRQLDIEEKVFSLIKINWISIFQGLILPSSQGQDVLRIYYIEKRHPQKRGSAGSTIIIERMIGFVLLALLSLLFSFFNKEIPNQKELILIIGLITFFLFLVIAFLLNKRLHGYLSKKSFSNKYLQKAYDYFDKIYKAIAYFPYRKVLFSSIILILLFQLSTIISVYLIFKAYGFDIPLYKHISLYPIISILSMIPITISGLGIREGFFVYFYAQLGVPSDMAVIVSLVNYIIIVLTPAFIGCLFYINEIFNRKKTI